MKLTSDDIKALCGDMAIKDLSPKDANSGGRIIKNMRICGSGLYEYHVSEAPLMGLVIPGDYKDEFFKIFRSPEVLEKNKDLYARVPIITGHHVRVNTSNAKQLAVGMVGDTVQSEVGDDGETYLYTTGTIIAGDGIAAYEKYGELSVGYDPIVRWAPGTYKGQQYQAVLDGFNEINHLLICPTARGGHQCMIMDSLSNHNKFKTILNGGRNMGVFAKIFGAKPMTGDARVVEVLLDSIKVGADPKTQVAAVRSMMGDKKDETFTGYLDELAGITGDEDKAIVAKAIDTVKKYYSDNLAGDACSDEKKPEVGDEPKKEVKVEKDGDKKNVEVEKDGKVEKDIEVKKDEDKKDVTVKENGDAVTAEMVAKMVGDAIAAEFAKRDAVTKVNDEPKVNGDELARLSAVMTGDNAKAGVTSDSIMGEIFS